MKMRPLILRVFTALPNPHRVVNSSVVPQANGQDNATEATEQTEQWVLQPRVLT